MYVCATLGQTVTRDARLTGNTWTADVITMCEEVTDDVTEGWCGHETPECEVSSSLSAYFDTVTNTADQVMTTCSRRVAFVNS